MMRSPVDLKATKKRHTGMNQVTLDTVGARGFEPPTSSTPLKPPQTAGELHPIYVTTSGDFALQ